MNKTTKIILVLIGLIAVVVFKELSKGKIREEVLNETESAIVDENSFNEASQNWFVNTQYGLVFETPKALKVVNIQIPQGAEDYISSVYAYALDGGEWGINYLIMETKFKSYDTKEGLKGSVGNLVNTKNGGNLSLKFYEINNKYNDMGCEGTFDYKNVTIYLRGYCFFNEQGRVYTLIASGANNESTNNEIKRVFESVRILN